MERMNQECYIKTSNVSPLRYPGGKTRACKILDNILIEHFDNLIVLLHLSLAEDLLNFIYKINMD